MLNFAELNAHLVIFFVFIVAYMKAATAARLPTSVNITAHSVKISQSPVAYRASTFLRSEQSAESTTVLDILGNMCT